MHAYVDSSSWLGSLAAVDEQSCALLAEHVQVVPKSFSAEYTKAAQEGKIVRIKEDAEIKIVSSFIYEGGRFVSPAPL